MSIAFESRTITLHIGTEKTGTSTLQTFLSNNQSQLAAAGLLYPESILLPGSRTHTGLLYYAAGVNAAVSMRKGRETLNQAELENYTASLIPKLSEEIAASACPHILMSSEHLSSRLRKPSETGALIGGLAKLARTINVVVYFRPQYELYASTYSTRIKGGSSRPPRPPAELRDHVFNYDTLLNLWEAAPGIASIKVRLFRRAHFKNGDLVDDFFDAIGVDMPAGLQRPPRELNQRLDVGALEFLRTINQLGVDASLRTPDRRLLIRLLGEISGQDSLSMPAATLQQIDLAYRESNAEVANRYFPHMDGVLFPPFVANKADPPETLSVAQAVEIGARLLQTREQENDQRREERQKRLGLKQRPGKAKREQRMGA